MRAKIVEKSDEWIGQTVDYANNISYKATKIGNWTLCDISHKPGEVINKIIYGTKNGIKSTAIRTGVITEEPRTEELFASEFESETFTVLKGLEKSLRPVLSNSVILPVTTPKLMKEFNGLRNRASGQPNKLIINGYSGIGSEKVDEQGMNRLLGVITGAFGQNNHFGIFSHLECICGFGLFTYSHVSGWTS
ncbi:hypothetical protein Bhyg_05811 [Pseudolycoriella hygida]|uniref:Uncharacterized protein n=1 Tax=Pseudolycoriella hygida TaxID=35572 RepID=A0A9Q0MZE3_9DIPT|nr:hypothetical protein Bhyg_05811 [Pseudolycoriella hygida]